MPVAPQRRILVVDDNPAVLKLIGSLFEQRGLAVALARSVGEARAALEAESTGFDLVLSDIQMPGESGFDLLQWVKAPVSRFAELPVLLTTSQLPEAEHRLKGLAMGAVDYVVRPIELEELVLRTIHAIDHFQRVRSLERALQSSESLAMVGRLMAASSHEMKNLAALVALSAEQVRRVVGSDGRAGAALRSLAESSALLTDVARNVTTLFDAERVPLSAVDLGALVAQVVDVMQPRIKPYRLVAPAPSAVWVRAHAVRLKQVLINLLLNARDAIEELAPEDGGRIAVRIEAQDAEVELRVVDNGIGLSRPGERSEFEAFATTKKLRGGSGLGLWLCARLVKTMGGALTLRSEGVGTGATAVVRLAAAAPADDDDLAREVARYLSEAD
jgi:signal transduction histidine kinase